MTLKKLINKEFFISNRKTLICFIVGLLGILLIFASEAVKTDKTDKKEVNTDTLSYTDELEEKLENLISSVEGAGKTNVLLTLEETEEYVFAQDTSSSIQQDSQNNTQKEYVIVDDGKGKGGLLIKTVKPKVRGVAIVCEGGDDPLVQQRIYSCVSASLGISTARISISKMTSLEVNNEK